MTTDATATDIINGWLAEVMDTRGYEAAGAAAWRKGQVEVTIKGTAITFRARHNDATDDWSMTVDGAPGDVAHVLLDTAEALAGKWA